MAVGLAELVEVVEAVLDSPQSSVAFHDRTDQPRPLASAGSQTELYPDGNENKHYLRKASTQVIPCYF